MSPVMVFRTDYRTNPVSMDFTASGILLRDTDIAITSMSSTNSTPSHTPEPWMDCAMDWAADTNRITFALSPDQI